MTDAAIVAMATTATNTALTLAVCVVSSAATRRDVVVRQQAVGSTFVEERLGDVVGERRH
jgi:hypothetical protein